MSTFITNDGVEISYHELGNSNNPTVVFINGYSGTEITWVLQRQTFFDAGWHVITYDARNHGRSQTVTWGMTIHRLATDLHQLIEHLGLTDIALVGHSMGAITIMAYQELFGDEYIRVIVTEDQAPTFLKSPNWLNGEGKTLEEMGAFIDAFPRMHLTKKPLTNDLKRELGRGMLAFDFHSEANKNLLRNSTLQDWRGQLTQEKVPHLFFAGSKSPVFPPAHAAAARALQPSPDSKIYIFDGCGHIPHLESPDEFNGLVLDFIK